MNRQVVIAALISSVGCFDVGPLRGTGSRSEPEETIDYGPLPSGEELFAGHVQAIGGEAALRAHSSVIVEGTVSVNDTRGTFVFASRAPDVLLATYDVEGVGRFRVGFDGHRAWADDPILGPRIIGGEELAALRFGADFYGDLQTRERFAELGKVESSRSWIFGEDGAYVVRARTTEGLVEYRSFSRKSGLLIGRRREVPVAGCERVVEDTVLSDYKDFEGQLIATKVRTMGDRQSSTLHIDRVRWDPRELPDVAVPEEVVRVYGTD